MGCREAKPILPAPGARFSFISHSSYGTLIVPTSLSSDSDHSWGRIHSTSCPTREQGFLHQNSSSSGASLSVHFSSTTVYCKHWLGKVVCLYSRMVSTGVCRSWSMCFCSHMCTAMPYMFASKNRHIFNCIGPSVQFCQT